ncbi:ATP-grasp fold amidoligase family protein [Nakamurella endophytica]|nr:ATP-grasp fold amidoligase family protein [Nakamurella endophytica]
MSDLTEWRALLVHRPLQWLSPTLHRQLRSLVNRRRLLDLRHPAAFNEKLTWRCLHDRRELLADTCDKLAMKDIAGRLGRPSLRIPRTYWSGTDLAELVDIDLPDRWVLKPNHRSGLVRFGAGPVSAADVDELRRGTRGWLREHLASVEGEWAYSRARRCFLVEERLPGETSPTDYKFFTFAGETRIVVVDSSRYGEHRRTVYTPEWQRLDVRIDLPGGPAEPPPPLLADMLDTARRLGTPYDFIRVDLYAVDGELWFGELTPYPGGGYGVVTPWSFELWLGEPWVLPDPAARPAGAGEPGDRGDPGGPGDRGDPGGPVVTG